MGRIHQRNRLSRRHRVAFLLACSLSLASGPAPASDCSVSSVGLTSLDDLGPGTYLGEVGGLYPKGVNSRPVEHDAAGTGIAYAIEPIDEKIVFISLGMSNTTQEFSTFVPLAMEHPDRNPSLLVVDTAQSGIDAEAMAQPGHSYWNNVHQRVIQAGATAEQVRVAWLKQALREPSTDFPAEELELKGYLRGILNILRDNFPNVELVFISSRIYAGYASTPLNPEPWAYQSGFAVKWLIEDQIEGNDPLLNYDGDLGTVEAPWIAWGPYLWSDGEAGRNDGLQWFCEDFEQDGTHPSAIGEQKVANLLLNFFATDTAAVPWFLDTVPAAVHSSTPHLSVETLPARPNPFAPSITLPLRLSTSHEIRIDVITSTGRLIRRLDPGRLSRGEHRILWDGADSRGRIVPSGTYFFRVVADGQVVDAVRVTLSR